MVYMYSLQEIPSRKAILRYIVLAPPLNYNVSVANSITVNLLHFVPVYKPAKIDDADLLADFVEQYATRYRDINEIMITRLEGELELLITSRITA